MIVNFQNPISFINDCNAIFNSEDLEKAIIWYQENPTTSKKHIYMFGEYPAVSIHKEKLHIHRLLMSYWLQTKLPKEYFVHHLDGNKLNASKRNLSLVFISEHQSMHNKGKLISDNTKKLISESNHNRKGVKIGITKNGVTYKKIWELHNKGYSINKISKELNYDWSQVKLRLSEIYENSELLESEVKHGND